MNSKWVTDLSIKGKTTKLQEETYTILVRVMRPEGTDKLGFV